MKKMPKEILHIFCAIALAVASVPASVYAEDILQETELILESVEETAEIIIEESKETESSMEAEVVESDSIQTNIIETNFFDETETVVESESVVETESAGEIENATETEMTEKLEPIDEIENTLETENISETEDSTEIEELRENSEIEKNVTVTSCVLGDGSAGDVFRLNCVLSGYAEGTYELQWQYRTTDWYGNPLGDWINLPGANGMELDVEINEVNALKAWRVVVNEID